METTEVETAAAPAQGPALEQRVAALENELASLAQLLRVLALAVDGMNDPDGDPNGRFHFAALRGAAEVCKSDGPESLLLKFLALPAVQLPATGNLEAAVVQAAADDVQKIDTIQP